MKTPPTTEADPPQAAPCGCRYGALAEFVPCTAAEVLWTRLLPLVVTLNEAQDNLSIYNAVEELKAARQTYDDHITTAAMVIAATAQAAARVQERLR